jgi:putative oxidoreductase
MPRPPFGGGAAHNRGVILDAAEEAGVQRLFSMFPNGWPGRGILLLRLVLGSVLVEQGLSGVHSAPFLTAVAVQLAAALAGIFLAVGLWTPAAGFVVLACEFWMATTASADLQQRAVLGGIAAALAMLGPGAVSLDNLLFGRKRVHVRDASR